MWKTLVIQKSAHEYEYRGTMRSFYFYSKIKFHSDVGMLSTIKKIIVQVIIITESLRSLLVVLTHVQGETKEKIVYTRRSS